MLGLNPVEGIMIVMEKHVARVAGRVHNIPTNELPRLQRSSDIEWGMWKMYADGLNDGRYSNLRYYLVSSITNMAARAILRRALETVGVQLAAWPGRDFGMDTPEGKAILGERCPYWKNLMHG
jgi:hypothetical protein